MARYILSIDQGTTSSRAILFDVAGKIVHTSAQEFEQIFPENGWVEHDPNAIWDTTLTVAKEVLCKVEAQDVVGMGITNQRETTLVWDKHTGEPIYNAIVWQDRRTADYCHRLKAQGVEETVTQKTGLVLDPYFSATKVRWILENVPDAREKATKGDLLFGTVDSFLLWRLTNGAVHATDATNASRTLLFNIHTQQWDSNLLSLFDIPESMLPEVKDCDSVFGEAHKDILGVSLPIAGIAGDQQAALIGQACFSPGMVKSTYGTGCFVIANTGDKAIASHNKLLTTVGYRIQGKTTYAIEGSIFMAGATMQWLRDGIGLIDHASESLAMAESVGAHQSVYLVPAFTGLGAPYWNPEARGALVGMTRDTGPKEIVTAGLQSVAYQTRDLLEAMAKDGLNEIKRIRVDGGMVVNDWAMQFLSDVLHVKVDRPVVTETTALGAAMLAGLALGVFDSLDELSELWAEEHEFEMTMPQAQSEQLYQGWVRAVKGVEFMAQLESDQ
ncbi:glycerol kinase GlpK [Reinekea marina]|uniref:Glycerol kinase n=1 Tax=Reinekea marina TaxID=1310421 RepID=A0ABV7WWG5_9GAMM|nr:glycerol kinase GlpK [Reinekea marina]MDN3649024.1 glycerol kinase GlpK [Reinekea marina]